MASDQQDQLKSESTPNVQYKNICRICLESGEIPIFGGDGKPDLSQEITAFGAIKVCQNDNMPEHICNSCYALLQNAILFRDMAKKSEIAIKYQKTLMADTNLCIDEVKSNNSLASILLTSSYILQDHNYSRSEAFDEEENSSNRDNYDSESDSTSKQIIQEKHNIKARANVVSSKTKNIENIAIQTSCNICSVNFESPTDYYEHDLTPAHILNIKNLGKIKCDICNTKINRSYFLRHLLCHTFGPTPFGDKQKCKICDKTLDWEVDVKMHRQSDMHKAALKTVTELECPLCHATVKRVEIKPHLSRHVSIIANCVKQKCPICNKIMSYSYYDHHLKKRHNIDLVNKNRKTTSVLQDAATKSKISVNRQKKSIEENTRSVDVNTMNICEMCNLYFQRSNDYYEHIGSSEHMDVLKRNQRIECNICRKTMDKAHYLRHLNNHCFKPIRTNGVYTCKICDEISISDVKTHLGSESHKSSESAASQIECALCHMIVERDSLRTHLRHHVSEATSKQKCPICGKYMGFEYYSKHLKQKHNIGKIREAHVVSGVMYKHKDTYSNESQKKLKSYCCDQCGKVFQKACIFRAHCLTHGGERKFKCDLCPYRSITKGLLQGHMKTHLGIYKFKCDDCPKLKFLSKSNLTKHIKTHSAPIDFKCETCNKCFYRKSQLKQHMEVVHFGIKTFVCHLCNNRFGYKNALRTHLKAIHNFNTITTARRANCMKAEFNKDK